MGIFHSEYSIAQIEASIGKSPIVDETTNHWKVWDIATSSYVDTGVSAGVEAPYVVTLASNMTNTGMTYIYAGSENGYNFGHWYYYNGSAWTDGGAYQAAAADSALSDSSENPVQNKVVKAAIDAKASVASVAASEAELDRRILASFPTDSVSNAAVASFDDGADGIPVKSLTVNITPAQAEGTPTPESPLAISGWAAANITRTGRNLWGGTAARDGIKESMPSAVIDSPDYGGVGTIRFSATAAVEKVGYMPSKIFETLTQYTLIMTFNGFSQKRANSIVEYTDETTGSIDNAPEANTKYTAVKVTSAEKTVKYIRKTNIGGSTSVYYNETGLFKGVLTTDDFEEYKGTTYSITFPEAAGTVYGGTLTGNGDGTWTLTVAQILAELTWGDGSNEQTPVEGFKRRTFDNAFASVVQTNATNCPNNVGVGYSSFTDSGSYYVASNGTRVQLSLPDGTSNDTVVQIVGNLATPVSYNLTAASIKTLLGENNIFADCGDVAALTYRADPTLYIQKKLEALP